jgi:hypothetical protein
MGGERASTTRMRLAGKICAGCRTFLSNPEHLGERLCAKCTIERAPKRRIYMYFFLREGWYCQFLEEDLKTPLPKTTTVETPAKLAEIASRGGYVMNEEGRKAFEHAVQNGRGGIWLQLTDDQYAKLKR